MERARCSGNGSPTERPEELCCFGVKNSIGALFSLFTCVSIPQMARTFVAGAIYRKQSAEKTSKDDVP